MHGNEDLVFFKSSFSNGSAECIEVAESIDGSRYVRDSKDTTGPMLQFTTGEWTAFVKGVKADEFGV
jgi:hypothetical protein